jgi:hypothetical protein
MLAVGHVAQDQLQTSDRDTGDLEPSVRVGEHAEAGATDHDQRIGHGRTALRVYDDPGYDPRLLSADRQRKREGVDEQEPDKAAR